MYVFLQEDCSIEWRHCSWSYASGNQLLVLGALTVSYEIEAFLTTSPPGSNTSRFLKNEPRSSPSPPTLGEDRPDTRERRKSSLQVYLIDDLLIISFLCFVLSDLFVEVNFLRCFEHIPCSNLYMKKHLLEWWTILWFAIPKWKHNIYLYMCSVFGSITVILVQIIITEK